MYYDKDMRVQNIQFLGYPKNPRKNTKKIKTENPFTQSIKTAGAWFGFGVGLDFVGRKCAVFKSPTKNSLFINSVLAFLAGSYTLFKTSHKKS